MPSLSERLACESSAAASVQRRDSEDQFTPMSDRPSTWFRAPAPARFVRKQNRVDIKSPNVSWENMDIACESNTSASVEIDVDIWTFANSRNSTGRAHSMSTQSKYYLAHRQHVAGELTKSETVQTAADNSSSELWDGFLRVLSV